MVFVETKFNVVLRPGFAAPNLGNSYKMSYDIPDTLNYPGVDEDLSYDDVLNLVSDSKDFLDENRISEIRSEIYTDSEPFFRKIKTEGPSEIYSDTMESARTHLNSDLTIFEKVFEHKGELVNGYVLEPSRETFRPLIENTPFVQQVQESCQSSVVDDLLNLCSNFDLMGRFSFLFQLSKPDLSYFSYYTDLLASVSEGAVSSSPAAYDAALLTLGGLSAGFGDHTITVLGFLGFFANSFYSNPGALILPPDLFVSSYYTINALQDYSVGMMLNKYPDELQIVCDFSDRFLQSVNKTNSCLSNSLSIYKEFGILKSQPTYLKYLKWLRDPESFNLSVKVGISNKSVSMTIGSNWFTNIKWGVVGASVGTVLLGLAYSFIK